MKPIKWILLVAFAGLIFPQLTTAETISQTIVMDWQGTDWTEKTACVDQFDTSLGTLKKVSIEMESCGLVNYTLHNEDSSEQCFIVIVHGRSLTTLPNGDVIEIDLPDQTEEFCVEPGGSYGSIIEDCTPSDTIDYTDADKLVEFIGSGEVCFVTDAEVSLALIGTSSSFSVLYEEQMMQKLTVTYEYETPSCISGHKFNDLTDEGLSGWTIKLKDASGAVIATTTTGADGSYEFCDLLSGSYTVCEAIKQGWTNVGPACIPVELVDENVEDIDFRGKPSKNIPCGSSCPWFIKNELYTASCIGIKEVDASKGILANDPDGTTVINPELITIEPKYGTIVVEEDGSFVFDPSPEIKSGTYVMIKYGANNGICDARYLGTAKIQVGCKRS